MCPRSNSRNQKWSHNLDSLQDSLRLKIESVCILVRHIEFQQHRLWSFQERDTNLEMFLRKIQHTQRKCLNFDIWTNGEPQ